MFKTIKIYILMNIFQYYKMRFYSLLLSVSTSLVGWWNQSITEKPLYNLYTSIINSDLDAITKAYQSGGLDIIFMNEYGENALMIAVKYNQFNIVKFLVEHGININEQNPHTGNNALFYINTFQNPEILHYLIDNGINLNCINNKGENILMISVSVSNYNFVRYLVEKGININVTNKCGKTALMMAVILHDEKMVAYLLQNGADINMPSKEGLTVLMLAIQTNCYIELIKILVNDPGLDLTIVNNYGQDALTFAKVVGNSDVIRLVSKKQANDGQVVPI